ncbi:hypothetical protein AJ78_00442 [Emergomyces pasteurianus Ep9510]|uniref:Uncharacterized protein n=1 Tax=Emergomyces pasteurianus Ep9510 TaxID=1447872 RepID=A0A1J9PT45_9EURO|nr:hypothetical protein AJ78_00442 [Emergomyces pasteurianus Ep9510]
MIQLNPRLTGLSSPPIPITPPQPPPPPPPTPKTPLQAVPLNVDENWFVHRAPPIPILRTTYVGAWATGVPHARREYVGAGSSSAHLRDVRVGSRRFFWSLSLVGMGIGYDNGNGKGKGKGKDNSHIPGRDHDSYYAPRSTPCIHAASTDNGQSFKVWRFQQQQYAWTLIIATSSFGQSADPITLGGLGTGSSDVGHNVERILTAASLVDCRKRDPGILIEGNIPSNGCDNGEEKVSKRNVPLVLGPLGLCYLASE